MRRRNCRADGVTVVCALAGLLSSIIVTTQADAAGGPATLQLDIPLHVTALDGTDRLLQAGDLRVTAHGTDRLEIESASGTTIIPAVSVTHSHPLDAPKAVLIQENDEVLHIVLALPGGTALDATGSTSGIRSRANLSGLGPARLNQALSNAPIIAIKSAPTVTLSPAQGPSGTMVTITVSNFPLPPQQVPQMREAEVKLDNVTLRGVTLLPCSNGTLGLGEDCGSPPLMVRIEGAPGSKKSVSVETRKNLLLGSPFASAVFTIDLGPAIGQTPSTTPTLFLDPASGPPGTLVEARACGFPTMLEHKVVRFVIDGQVTGTATMGRCLDGTAGFGRDAVLSATGLFTRAVMVVDGPPGPKSIQAQVESNSGPPSTAVFTMTAVPPVPIAARFQVVLDGLAVLDKETGLTWERAPSEIARTTASFQGGRLGCHKRILSNRTGWRLPTLDELASLVDTTRRSPALPLGHPFSFPTRPIQYWQFWTTTVDFENPQAIYVIDMNSGAVTIAPINQSGSFGAWCVRGIPGPEKQ